MSIPSGLVLGNRARVVNVVDGNLLDIEMELGFHHTLLQRCRLDGIDAPDLSDPDPGERTVAEHARDFIEVLVLGKEVVVVTQRGRVDESGQCLAVIHWRDAGGDWSNLNEDMVENGLAGVVTEACVGAAPSRGRRLPAS